MSTTSIFSRRHLLRSAPIAAAAALATSSNAQAPGQGVDVEQNYAAVLQSEDTFLFVSGAAKELLGPIPEVKGYLRFQEGKPIKSSPPKAFKLPGAVERTYHVRRKASGLHVPVKITVPITEDVELELMSWLFIKDSASVDADKRTRIEAAFRSFDPQQSPDVHAYAAPLLGPAGVTVDMFLVRQSWRLMKVGNRTEHVDAENALRQLYGLPNVQGATVVPKRGAPLQGAIAVWPDLKSLEKPSEVRWVRLSDQLAKDGITLHRIAERPLGELPPRVSAQDPAASNPQDLDIGIQKAIQEGLKGASCDAMGQPLKYDLARISAVPEFKLGGRIERIKIGCVSTDVWVPQLYIRFQELVLIGFVNNVQGVPQQVLEDVKKCLLTAIAGGVIIGLVMSDFKSAVTAFKVVFHECAKRIGPAIVACFIPGLALLLREDGDWRPV